MTPRGRFLADLTADCLDHGSLFYDGRPYGKTVAVVLPDGGVKRMPTIRVQVAVWTRFHGTEIAIPTDRWMTKKIDQAIAAWRRDHTQAGRFYDV